MSLLHISPEHDSFTDITDKMEAYYKGFFSFDDYKYITNRYSLNKYQLLRAVARFRFIRGEYSADKVIITLANQMVDYTYNYLLQERASGRIKIKNSNLINKDLDMEDYFFLTNEDPCKPTILRHLNKFILTNFFLTNRNDCPILITRNRNINFSIESIRESFIDKYNSGIIEIRIDFTTTIRDIGELLILNSSQIERFKKSI